MNSSSLKYLFQSILTATSSKSPSSLLHPPLSKPHPQWHTSFTQAHKLIHTDPPPPAGMDPDIVVTELKSINMNITKLLHTNNQLLSQLAKYYFQNRSNLGKQLRPLLILLIAKATAQPARPRRSPIDINHALTPNPDPFVTTDTYAMQCRLAEITELIHTASLLHDDVIDEAKIRRGIPTLNMLHGNKLSILAGDYLLSRASVFLARLQHLQVIELLASVISDLVQGEIMQATTTSSSSSTLVPTYTSNVPTPNITHFDLYLEKSYLKTASLMAKSCHATCLLGNTTPELTQAARTFGTHFGLAFQLVDDILDFRQHTGKPQFADLKAGLVTAPVLFASESNPDIVPAILSNSVDVDAVVNAVTSANSIQQTYMLAQLHVDSALAALDSFCDSAAKSALLDLTRSIIHRSK